MSEAVVIIKRTILTCKHTRSSKSSSYLTSGNSLETSRQADKNIPSDIFLHQPMSDAYQLT